MQSAVSHHPPPAAPAANPSHPRAMQKQRRLQDAIKIVGHNDDDGDSDNDDDGDSDRTMTVTTMATTTITPL